MCLALSYLGDHSSYRLVIAANRDEFHDRPAAAASWIEDAILAGRDLQAGGTWLGLRRDGRFALVTNFREAGPTIPNVHSRGALPLRILQDESPLRLAMGKLLPELHQFNGFNLLVGNTREMFYLSNRAEGVRQVEPGIHGLSNHLLDTPWPKVEQGKAGISIWLQSGSENVEGLFSLLGDRSIAQDQLLPTTGVPLEWERTLSPPFILSPTYGTRCSTVVLITHDGEVTFSERRFGATGEAVGASLFEFALENSAA